MIDKNWPRWVSSSIAKSFVNTLSPKYVYVEDAKRPTNENLDRFELRGNSPEIEELQKDYFSIKTYINLLVQVAKDASDVYKLDRFIGEGRLAFKNGIEVFKLGNGPDDDGSSLGCIQLISPITVSVFGQVDPTTSVLRATLESDYQMFLEGI